MGEGETLTKGCFFFSRGLCAKRDDCPYLHDERLLPCRVGNRSVLTKPCPFFSRRLCTKGECCPYLHDERAVPKDDAAMGTGGGCRYSNIVSRARMDMEAAMSLREYVQNNGGEMLGSRMSAFYRLHPEARIIIGGRPRAFCAKHSDLLRFRRNGGPGVIASMHVKGCRHRWQPSSQATVAEGSLSDAPGVALAKIVTEEGGSMPASQVLRLHAGHPDAKDWFASGLRSFCAEHPGLLRFDDVGGQGFVICVEGDIPQGSAAKDVPRSLVSSSAGLSVVGADMSTANVDDASRSSVSSSAEFSVAGVDLPRKSADDAPRCSAPSSTGSYVPRVGVPIGQLHDIRLTKRADSNAQSHMPEPQDAAECTFPLMATFRNHGVLRVDTPKPAASISDRERRPVSSAKSKTGDIHSTLTATAEATCETPEASEALSNREDLPGFAEEAAASAKPAYADPDMNMDAPATAFPDTPTPSANVVHLETWPGCFPKPAAADGQMSSSANGKALPETLAAASPDGPASFSSEAVNTIAQSYLRGLSSAMSIGVSPLMATEYANIIALCQLQACSAASTTCLRRTSRAAGKSLQFVLHKNGRSKTVIASADITAEQIVQTYGRVGSWELKLCGGDSIFPSMRLCEAGDAEALEFALEPDDF